MARFRKRPVEIEATQWDGTADGATTIVDWILAAGATATYMCSDPDRCAETDGDTPHVIVVRTLEGDMTATVGDWIIKGIKGEFYPIKPDIFTATYEPGEADRPARAALIEIVEKNYSTNDDPGVIIPNEIRINGTPLLIPAGQQIKVHSITLNENERVGTYGEDAACVTLTLFARRVTIAAEGDL